MSSAFHLPRYLLHHYILQFANILTFTRKMVKIDQIEAIARDYSEFHIDIATSPTDEIDENGLVTPRTPKTFDAMVSPRSSSRGKSKRNKFNLRKLFGRKPDGSPSSPTRKKTSPASLASPNSSSSPQALPDDPISPISVPPTSPSAAATDK